MMINAKYYVYIWKIKENQEVFYVGKGSGNRYKSMKDRNKHFKNIRAKYDCECEIVKYFDDEEKAYEYELELGKYYKSIGQARACHVLGNIRKYIDDDTLSKMKKTTFKKNYIPWNKGKKMSDELRKKLSDSHKGKKQSEETKKKRSNSLKGHNVSDKTIKKCIETHSKKVLEIDALTEKVINEYNSSAEIARKYNVKPSTICQRIKYKRIINGKYLIHKEQYGNLESV